MAKNTKTKSRGSDTAKSGNTSDVTARDNMRWIAGFAIIAAGIYLLCAIASFFFCWKSDMSAVAVSAATGEPAEIGNICGASGAALAAKIVGRGFGAFAIVIPLFMLLFGWRLFRYKPLQFNYTALSTIFVVIMGALTFGYVFGTSWDLFGSGIGGEYGLSLSSQLTGIVGKFGTLLVIIAGWILTGLFINRNFLGLVDSAGEKVAGGVSGAASWLWGKMPKRKGAQAAAAATATVVAEQSVAQSTPTPTPAPTPVPEPAPVVAEPIIEALPKDAVITPATTAAAAEGVATNVIDDYPFKDPSAPIEEFGAVAKPEESVAVASDDPFMVVPRTDNAQPLSPIDVASVLGVGTAATAAATTEEEHHDEEVVVDDNLVITVTENPVKQVAADDISQEIYDPMRDLYSYTPPMPSLLTDHKSRTIIDEAEIFENKERIRETLLNFGIPIRSMHATVGPTVTLYEIVQEQGVKISKIQGLENDIAQNLKALGIRIIAPIPGRGTVGIEVPNQTKQTVSMYSAICSQEFQSSKAELPVVIGRTIQNENYTFDLAKMPHLLVAGATGQGKSVGLNAIITSLLYRKHPAELKFVLIDPKMVEFSLYSRLEKHFLAKMESEDESIVTDPKKAVYTLNALCTEMSNRLELCKQAHAKNIVEYNDKFLKRRLNPENGHRFLPYIVVVIDEFADLIMTAKEVEAPVMRLAQKARAIGIHLIVATQRPDVRVITGGIKANFPARIAFRVMQMTDSRTIIDQPGANQLIGRGDMLLSNGGELTRIQCAFVDTPEVENIVEHIASQQGYATAYNLPDYTPEAGGADFTVSFGSEESSAPQKYDPKFGEIAREAVSSGIISTSMIQRNFEVGFNRAGRIMLQLERAGIVGPQVGSKPREIKYYDLPSLEARLQELGIF